MDKKELRNQILNIRDNLDTADKTYLDSRLTLQVLSLDKLRKAETVMCFVSYGSEADTTVLIDTLLEAGKKIAVPRVNGENMDFYLINSRDELVDGYKGISEPGQNCELFTPGKGDVMIVPGVVFDELFFRIGYGKGFYDRYLEKNKGIYTIGMCYDFQVVESIPRDKWDHGLEMVVTEKRKMIY